MPRRHREVPLQQMISCRKASRRCWSKGKTDRLSIRSCGGPSTNGRVELKAEFPRERPMLRVWLTPSPAFFHMTGRDSIGGSNSCRLSIYFSSKVKCEALCPPIAGVAEKYCSDDFSHFVSIFSLPKSSIDSEIK